jgi:hypothetical protein
VIAIGFGLGGGSKREACSDAYVSDAHTTFLLLDATSASQIEEALAPVINIGWAETRPVVDFAEVMARVTEDG